MRPLWPLALLLVVGCASVRRYPIEAFMENTSHRGASFSPDGSKVLVSSDRTGVYNAYALPVDGSAPIPLTRSTTDSIYTISYFPKDERFLYSSDQGGNERTHIFVRHPNGSVQDLTPGDEVKARFMGWATDGLSFFLSTNERDPKHFDLYRVRVDGYARERIYENRDGLNLSRVSPDGSAVAVSESITRNESRTWIVTGEDRREVGKPGADIAVSPQAFSPDGRELLYVTDRGGEFRYLVRHSDGQVVFRPRWDVRFASYSKTGRYVALGVNEDARTRVRVLETATLKPVPLPDLPGGEISSVSFSWDDGRIAFYLNSSRSPADLHVYDFESKQVSRLTRSLNRRIRERDLVNAKVVRFKSYDGVEIPGILYRPRGKGPFPALVWVHGGPGGQSRVGYRATIQYLVNHGYLVYAINNRGSSGYGKTFYSMDDGKHGDADLKDCIASKKFLIGTGDVDPERIGIIGGSYGGYMVLAALAFEPDAFKVGVDIFGVANWIRTLKSIPPWWAAGRRALFKEIGDPDQDAEYLKRISPLFHADRIRRPLMVLQGANDPRVHKVESDEMVEAVRANGVPVEYIVFDDEGHGFRKKKNQARGYRAILDFLLKHLP